MKTKEEITKNSALLVTEFISEWSTKNYVSIEDVVIGIEFWGDGTGRTLFLYNENFSCIDSIELKYSYDSKSSQQVQPPKKEE